MVPGNGPYLPAVDLSLPPAGVVLLSLVELEETGLAVLFMPVEADGIAVDVTLPAAESLASVVLLPLLGSCVVVLLSAVPLVGSELETVELLTCVRLPRLP